ILVARNIDSVGRAWQYLLALGAGTGLVLILRWYWWRINAWSEISAMIASFTIGLAALWLIPPRFAPDDPNAQAWVMIVTVVLSTVVWVSVTFATAPE